jgi:hypothetical protein
MGGYKSNNCNAGIMSSNKMDFHLLGRIASEAASILNFSKLEGKETPA